MMDENNIVEIIEDLLKEKNKIYYSKDELKNELLKSIFNNEIEYIIDGIIKDKTLKENKFSIVDLYNSLKNTDKIIKIIEDKLKEGRTKSILSIWQNKIYYSKDELKNELLKSIEDIINRIIKDKTLNENKFSIVDLYNSLSPNPIYDLIINIKSILQLNEGWDIIYEGNTENINRVKNCINKDKIIAAVIGHSNRGKTYLLQLISNLNINYASNYSYQTKGISIKIPENTDLVLLDSYGGNAPILVDDEKNDIRDKERNEYEIELIKNKNAQIISNYLIQNFIINEATFLICIVGLLSSEEQKYIHKIKNQCINAEIDKKLLIVHNLYMYNDIEQVNDYIKNTLLKSLTFKLEKHKIATFEDYKRDYYKENKDNDKDKDNNKNLENIYFQEKIEGKKKITIFHLILVNEGIKDAKIYP